MNTIRLFSLWLTVVMALSAAPKRAWDCTRVTKLQTIGGSAYEITVENVCDQDFKAFYLSIRFLDKDGYKIGQCVLGIRDFNAHEKFHEIQGTPVVRSSKLEVRKISDKEAEVQ